MSQTEAKRSGAPAPKPKKMARAKSRAAPPDLNVVRSTGIAPAEYTRRRRRLMDGLHEDAVALIPGALVRLRNGDTAYPFRQDSNFLYLTGFDEPQSLLVLVPGRSQGESILFCREREPRAERYDGERLGPERAASALGLDDAFPWEDVDEILPGLIEGRRRVYFPLGADADFDRRVLGWLHLLRSRVGSDALPQCEFVDIGHLLHDLRLVKSAAELRLMRQAGAISAAAHCRAMQVCRPGMTEGDLEAELLYSFRRAGAREPAYECIVAGGENACTLHYVRNSDALADGALVLIDAGCEYAGYAADITRTFPSSGRFTPVQRELYDLVLAAQHAAIDAARSGAHFNAPHEAAERVLTQGLMDLKLLDGPLDTLIETEAARRFCMHKTSHWLGLDVHDVGDYRVGEAWRELEPGMVLTVEPGLYFPPELDDVPEAFKGIGIRIEDDVVITRGEPEVLTGGVPKSPDAIEALMAEGR